MTPLPQKIYQNYLAQKLSHDYATMDIDTIYKPLTEALHFGAYEVLRLESKSAKF